jgi:flagellar L-ring protein precursor FlgH
MHRITLTLTLIALLATVGAPALGQSSSLFQRGESGEQGSNQPTAPADVETDEAVEPADDPAVRATDVAEPDPIDVTTAAATSARSSLTRLTATDAASIAARTGETTRDSILEPSTSALQANSFLAIPPRRPRQFQVHDLITIIVRESTSYSSESETETEKETSVQTKLESWIDLEAGNFAIVPSPMARGEPNIKGSASRTFEGEGEIERKDDFVGRITAQVIDVKPNGLLVLGARKFIKTDEEEQRFELAGLCRAEDVNADNTILSSQLADLVVRKVHKGAVRKATQRGLIPKALDWLNPW